jgi:hypothetical protein
MNKYLLLLLISISISFTPAHAQNIGGIGAQLFLDTMGGFTMPCVQGMVKNSAADQNLKATDFIIKVNDVDCRNKTMEEVIGMIRGEIGTTVKVTVADTKNGKNPREYDLLRGYIGLQSSSPNGMPAEDPAVAFNTNCDNEVAKMKKSGNTVIKTFPSDCGNYFFNFDVSKETYHIRIWAIADKNTDPKANKFSLTARVFDNTNEAAATQLTNFQLTNGGNLDAGQLDGTASFNKDGVGVINVQLHDDTKKCRAMYVVIYK